MATVSSPSAPSGSRSESSAGFRHSGHNCRSRPVAWSGKVGHMSDADFETWVASLGDDAGGDDGRRQWLLDFFMENGPQPERLVAMAWLLGQIQAAADAAVLVVRDVRSTTSREPLVLVDEFKDGVRITVDGGGSVTPAIWAGPHEQAQVLVEVADYIQSELMDNYGPVWPTCPEHGYGLHPELHEGLPCWRCRPGGHSVAPIGQL